jgi:hypothetical protein
MPQADEQGRIAPAPAPLRRRLAVWHKIISDVIAERLLASGLTEISGIHLRLKPSTNTHESDLAIVNEFNL